MKVAVSIPDEIFAETEHLAKYLKASRSEIYSALSVNSLGATRPTA
jgi:metal-responsive CopG/Arc/MetJ family transcriptional regulator